MTLDASGSSQLVSGLLLAAARFDLGIEVRHEGPPVPSLPHIEMTVRMIAEAGAEVEVGAGERPDFWRVRPGRLDLGDFTVEPDLSNAGPFLAAALVTGGSVTIRDWPPTRCSRPTRSWTCSPGWAAPSRPARTG